MFERTTFKKVITEKILIMYLLGLGDPNHTKLVHFYPTVLKISADKLLRMRAFKEFGTEAKLNQPAREDFSHINMG